MGVNVIKIASISCPNGRALEIALGINAENKPVYLALKHKLKGKRSEAVIVPISYLEKFEAGLSEARNMVFELERLI